MSPGSEARDVMTAERSDGVPALDRALTILESLAQSRKGYSASELSRRLNLPKSSVHLILRTLERRGYLQKQASGGRYRFGVRLAALSRTALDGVELRDEARPALAALVSKTGLTGHLGVLERSEIVIIERIESTSPVRVVSWVGRRMDVNSTAVGKALIAYLPEVEFDAQVRPTQLPRHNDRSCRRRHQRVGDDHADSGGADRGARRAGEGGGGGDIGARARTVAPQVESVEWVEWVASGAINRTTTYSTYSTYSTHSTDSTWRHRRISLCVCRSLEVLR
jgi:DNA-binding IclR family transcriptional regulator